MSEIRSEKKVEKDNDRKTNKKRTIERERGWKREGERETERDRDRERQRYRNNKVRRPSNGCGQFLLLAPGRYSLVVVVGLYFGHEIAYVRSIATFFSRGFSSIRCLAHEK